MVCTKKFVQNKWTILGPKMAYPHNSGSAPRIFKKFSRMKGAVRYMKFSLVIFPEKVSFGAIWSFYAIFYCLIGHGRNSARPLLLLGLKHSGHDFFNSQDMIRIFKQSRDDFSGKHLCDKYCMDITLFLSV